MKVLPQITGASAVIIRIRAEEDVSMAVSPIYLDVEIIVFILTSR
jgi:hypothetical protein